MPDTPRTTTPGGGDVESFLASVTDQHRRSDARAALTLIREVTGEQPVMWGSSIVGFGHRPYTTADGRSHDWFVIGLAPRKASLTLYGLTSYGSKADLLERLGPHTTGKGCVYVKRLEALDRDALVELLERAWAGDRHA